MQNATPNAAITWSSDSPAGLAINSSSGIASRINNFNGQVIITASLAGACGSFAQSRTVWVGAPIAGSGILIYPNGQRGVNPVTLGAYTVYQFNSDFVPQATSFTWQVPPGFALTSAKTTATPGIRTSSTEGSYTLYCSANNACGSSFTHSLDIVVSNYCTQCPIIAPVDG